MDEDYNRNKYLINSELGIYTRYKFTNGKIPYSDGTFSNNDNTANLFQYSDKMLWVNKSTSSNDEYYLFNNTTTPNSGKTTFLTESLVVTLGGGKDVQTSSSSGKTTPGKFKAV